MNDLRDAMRKEAGRVWREKAKAQQLGLFMNEETVTETILLQLAVQFQASGLRVRPFTKAQETKNGADWEFWFAQGSRAIGLRVQAKRLFPTGIYASLKPSGTQTHILIQKSGRCHPVFVFYNDHQTYPASEPQCLCGDYYGPSYRGCTLASAQTIRRQKSNDASKLAELTIPWHCLLCAWRSRGGKSLPVIIARSLKQLVINDGAKRRSKLRSYKTTELPHQLRSYAERGPRLQRDSIYDEPSATAGRDPEIHPRLQRDSLFDEPAWLAGYLKRRALAGVALIVAEREVE